jgi:hypothetical protein
LWRKTEADQRLASSNSRQSASTDRRFIAPVAPGASRSSDTHKLSDLR